MANVIETQARIELSNLEQVVEAVRAAGAIAGNLHSQDMEDYGYVTDYLARDLYRQFQNFHKTISQTVLPLVADMSYVR